VARDGILTRARDAWRTLRGAVAVPASVRRSWRAATVSRVTMDWAMRPVSAREELKGATLPKLRTAARDAVQNTALGARYVRACRDMTLGLEGMGIQSAAVSSRGKPLKNLRARQEALFADWCESCSPLGESWAEVCGQVSDAWRTDGEGWLELLPGFPNTFGFAVQSFDSDLVDLELTRPAREGQNEIRNGVELDKFGRVVRYWVLLRHPSEGGRREYRHLSPELLLRIGRFHRPGATRSVPDLAPALTTLRHLDGFVEAAVLSARVSSCKMGILIEPPDDAIVPMDTATTTGAEGETVAPDVGAGRKQLPSIEGEPGSMPVVPHGTTFEPWDPGQPSAAFAEFVATGSLWVAGAVHMTYATLTGDLSKGNYGSNRGGLIGERDRFKREAREFGTAIALKVWRAFIRQCVISQLLEPTAADPGALRARPQYRGYAWIDPLKDMQTLALQLQYFLTSPQRIISEMGEDWETLLAENKEFADAVKKAGLTLASAGDVAAKAAAARKTNDAADQADDAGAADSSQPGKAAA